MDRTHRCKLQLNLKYGPTKKGKNPGVGFVSAFSLDREKQVFTILIPTLRPFPSVVL